MRTWLNPGYNGELIPLPFGRERYYPSNYQFRQRLLYAERKNDGTPFTTEDLFGDKWYRASGGCICSDCGYTYKEHPQLVINGMLDGDHVLCNDDIVHL